MVLRGPSATPPAFAGAKGCGVDKHGFDLDGRPRFAKSGVQELDDNIGRERKTLNEVFNVEPNFSFFDDGDRPRAGALRKDPTEVLLGVNLARTEVKANPNHWGYNIMGVLAHEWAHALQYSSGFEEHLNHWETHADFMAGWYLGTKQATGLRVATDSFARFLHVRGGEGGFFNPDDYGSPERRVTAMRRGFQVGEANLRKFKFANPYAAAEMGYAFIINELKR
jgi:hypothetical protein